MRVLITGGAGYVGSLLVPTLLDLGYSVIVLDLYLFGEEGLSGVRGHKNLVEVKGDLRDQKVLRQALEGCDAVIHLACISNDPSFALDPNLSRSINYDAFIPLVKISKESGVKRFIYASTSSVYGISDAPDVREDHPLVPITDYNKYKGLCEPHLLSEIAEDFAGVVIRPATVCGYAPRMRLDLTVNILTNHAVNNKKITVFGGTQMRPNINIWDMVDLYKLLLELPSEKFSGGTYNAGYQNRKISDIAEIVASVVHEEYPEMGELEIVTTPSDDLRSYHVNSEKIERELGFRPQRSIEDAVRSICRAFKRDLLPDSMNDSRYFNVKQMQKTPLA
jgi:nucleoside-diphosphate-sugar epimerase